MIEKEKNGGDAYRETLTLQEYHDLSSKLNEAMELNGTTDLDPGHEIYAELEHHLTRIYSTDFKNLNDDARIILLQSQMRMGEKIGL